MGIIAIATSKNGSEGFRPAHYHPATHAETSPLGHDGHIFLDVVENASDDEEVLLSIRLSVEDPIIQ